MTIDFIASSEALPSTIYRRISCNRRIIVFYSSTDQMKTDKYNTHIHSVLSLGKMTIEWRLCLSHFGRFIDNLLLDPCIILTFNVTLFIPMVILLLHIVSTARWNHMHQDWKNIRKLLTYGLPLWVESIYSLFLRRNRKMDGNPIIRDNNRLSKFRTKNFVSHIQSERQLYEGGFEQWPTE